jgi:translation initiation factor 2 gamma subunit (eIF-2gamma)
MRLQNIIILQNKVDLVKQDVAEKQFEQIKVRLRLRAKRKHRHRD